MATVAKTHFIVRATARCKNTFVSLGRHARGKALKVVVDVGAAFTNLNLQWRLCQYIFTNVQISLQKGRAFKPSQFMPCQATLWPEENLRAGEKITPSPRSSETAAAGPPSDAQLIHRLTQMHGRRATPSQIRVVQLWTLSASLSASASVSVYGADPVPR